MKSLLMPNVLKIVACATVVCAFSRTPHIFAASPGDYPEIGWIVSNDSDRVAWERLTPEQERAGVKAWALKLGGNWNAVSLDKVQQVGDNTTLDLNKLFWRMSKGEVISISSGVKGSTFKGQKTIQKLIIPEELYRLGFSSTGSQFLDCTGLEEVTPFLPGEMKSIPDKLFSGCQALRGDLDLPIATSVGTYAFMNTKITSANLGFSGTNIVTIAKQAFNGCTCLTNFVISSTNGWRTTTTSQGTGENFKDCTALRDFTMMSFPVAMQETAFITHTESSNNYYKIRFLVPRGVIDEQGLLTNGITPWVHLDQTIKDAFFERWPDEMRPLGLINEADSSTNHIGLYGLPAKQFLSHIPYPSPSTKLIFK